MTYPHRFFPATATTAEGACDCGAIRPALGDCPSSMRERIAALEGAIGSIMAQVDRPGEPADTVFAHRPSGEPVTLGEWREAVARLDAAALGLLADALGAAARRSRIAYASFVKAQAAGHAAGRDEERAAVVAWLRSGGPAWLFAGANARGDADPWREAASYVERGDHREGP